MAKSKAELALLITANFKDFKSNLDKASKDFSSFGKNLTDTGKSLTLGLTTVFAGLGVAATGSAMKMDSLMKGLTAVTGSSEAAANEFERLKEVAKLPGLGLEEAVQGAINLQAAGFSATQAEDALKSFGNALATVGKGKAELDGVILALGQIKSKGKVSAEEINQLAERVPQIRAAMQGAFGTADTEVLQKMGISADEFVDKVVSKLGELPPVTGGLQNAWENLGDSVKQSLAAVGTAINNAFDLEGIFNKLSDALAGVVAWFNELSPTGQRIVVVLAAVLAGIGPLVVAIGFLSSSVVPQFINGLKVMQAGFTALSSSVVPQFINRLKVMQAGFTALSGPIGIIILAVAALTAGIIAFTSEASAAEIAQHALNNVNTKAKESIAAQKVEMEQLLRVAQDETKSKDERIKAVQALNALSPEYLGNLKLENINTQEATIATQNYVAALLAKAKAQAAQERLVEIEKEMLRLQTETQARLSGEAGLWQEIKDGVRAYAGGVSTAALAANDYVEASRALKAEQEALIPILSAQPTVVDAVAKSYDRVAASATKAAESIQRVQTGGAESIATKDVGMLPTSQPQEQVDVTSSLDLLDVKLQEIQIQTDATAEKFTELGKTVGDSFAQQTRDGENFLQAFGKAVYNTIRGVIKAFLAEAIAGFVAKSLATLGPAGIAVAAAAPGIVGGLFDSLIPALAQGGIAMGPTLALIGEGKGPEAVIPLDKLPKLMGSIGGGQTVEVFGTIQGNDIFLSNRNAFEVRNKTF